MRYGSIYVATNKHTGDQYVGQTRQSVAKRWAAHWRTAVCSTSRKAKFQDALVTHGRDAFEVSEVFMAFDAAALNAAEITFIAELKPVYNATRGGRGLRPIVVTDAVRRARSIATKARWENPEWRQKAVLAIQAASRTPEATERGKRLAKLGGVAIRWAGHQKKAKPLPVNRSELIAASWKNSAIRDARMAGLKKSFDNPLVRAKMSEAQKGRQLSDDVIKKIARSKWRPVYCPELACTFLSMTAAAEFLGVLKTSVSNAVRQKGRVLRQYSLEKVA
jgi:group I intron endonuclease